MRREKGNNKRKIKRKTENKWKEGNSILQKTVTTENIRIGQILDLDQYSEREKGRKQENIRRILKRKGKQMKENKLSQQI